MLLFGPALFAVAHVVALISGVVCFTLRVLAATYGWRLPKASHSTLA